MAKEADYLVFTSHSKWTLIVQSLLIKGEKSKAVIRNKLPEILGRCWQTQRASSVLPRGAQRFREAGWTQSYPILVHCCMQQMGLETTPKAPPSPGHPRSCPGSGISLCSPLESWNDPSYPNRACRMVEGKEIVKSLKGKIV